MILNGKHRSLRLAERHLRSLQRENPRAKVRIVARENGKGVESLRGHFWTFAVVRPKAKKRKIRRVSKERKNLLAFLLSFSYAPRQQKSHGGNKAKLRADFIVAGNSGLAGKDSVEVFQILIEKVIRELDDEYRWLAHLAQQVVGSERAEVDSSVIKNLKPPKKAKIRSAYRAGKLLYGSPSSERE